MKKKTKKLVLSKETVRSLELATLNEVMGGSAYPCGGGTGSSCRICLPDSINDICY